MTKRIGIALAGLLLSTTAPSLALAKAPAAKVEKFGQPLSGNAATPLSAVVKNPDAFAGKSVLVDGKVRAACTRKGCWMELAPGIDKGTQGCRVTFENYGFFVPTDSAGAAARVEGVLSIRSVSAAEVAHLESEGASFDHKDKDGGARELRMVATGVELRR